MKSQVAVIDMAQHRTDAVIEKGRKAWKAIKGTAAEQRFWWLDVGLALAEGKRLHPSNQAFGKWCEEAGFDMSSQYRSGAMFVAHNWEFVSRITGNVSDPIELQRIASKQQATQALPEPLQEVAPTSTPTLSQRDAERVAKTIQRAASKDEGSDTAKRHVEGLAKKHGLTVPELTQAAINGAPDTYFRLAPTVQIQLDEFRENLRVSVREMQESDISIEAIKAIFIHFANSL